MLGLEEASHDLVLVAVIGAIGGIVVAVIQNLRGFRGIKRDLDTGNGHTAGEALARMEDLHRENANRLDRLEVTIAEMRLELREGKGPGAITPGPE